MSEQEILPPEADPTFLPPMPPTPPDVPVDQAPQEELDEVTSFLINRLNAEKNKSNELENQMLTASSQIRAYRQEVIKLRGEIETLDIIKKAKK